MYPFHTCLLLFSTQEKYFGAVYRAITQDGHIDEKWEDNTCRQHCDITAQIKHSGKELHVEKENSGLSLSFQNQCV
jgi:hypothetical protein